MKPIILEPGKLTWIEFESVVRKRHPIELSSEAKSQIKLAHAYLQKQLTKTDAIYGVNTGFGKFSNVRIPQSKLRELQVNFLRSHSAGVGEPLGEEAVRGMLLLRAASLACGYSGVPVSTVEALLTLLNRGVHPIVPSQGSVGASGDLAPLAHLALVLIGEGQAMVEGKILPGARALKHAGLKPLKLGPKEGLALTNGTQFMTSLGAIGLLQAERLLRTANLAAALSLEGLRGSSTAFRAELQSVRPHAGQARVARDIFKLLAEGQTEIAKSHKDCDRVQDPYSLRCVPQVHGASADAIAFIKKTLEIEMSSVTDNPLIFSREKEILSGGNFHGQPLAMALDLLAIAVAELASISGERISKLINPEFSRLPAFLAPEGGLNSGFMIVQYTSASIVSENKTLCHPAVVDSIPTSNDKEDHVSMGAWAARKALKVIENAQRVLSIELLVAAQAIDLLRPLKTSPALEREHARIRKISPKLTVDRSMAEDIGRIQKEFFG